MTMPLTPASDGAFYTMVPTLDAASVRPRSTTSDLRRFLRANAVQRCLSAAVLVPVVTYFLWRSPAMATATFCAFVASICAYEYAWLAHRIHTRIMTQLEVHELASCSSIDPITNNRHASVPPLAARSSRQSSTSSRTTPGDSEVEMRASVLSVQSSVGEEGDRLSEATKTTVCAVTSVAKKYFGGNEWLAAICLSVATTAVTSCTFLWVCEYIPELTNRDLYRMRVLYSVVTDLVAALSAFFAPNWQFAFICLVHKWVFTLLTVHSTICPINQFTCGLTTMDPAQIFLVGFVVILLARLFVRGTNTNTVVFMHILLDMLGYLYIIGTLSVIVAFVDDERLESYRKLLVVLLYVVWASDTGAYMAGKVLTCLEYRSYHPLAIHLSKNKDYEGTLVAIIFGVTAMYVVTDLLDVPGSTLAKTVFSVLAVVSGRLGDLFESLLKRAALAKDSGTLIPGHGGVLDRIDALMFASLVFSRYYATIVTTTTASQTTS